MTSNPSVDHVKTDHLCGGRLFAGISSVQLEPIAEKMRAFSVPSGRLIMQHGDKTTDVFFLLSGKAVGQISAENGRQILFTEMTVGDHFGELAALDGAERSITISATSDCEVATLRQAEFLTAMKSCPQMGINLAIELGARLRSMNERVFNLVVHDVETRVGLRLMQLAQIQGQLMDGGIISKSPTHEAIASFIGSNREAVSRTIARLNKLGIIQTDRKKIVIEDLGRLLEIAS
jgi:CRP-like cAMP-binding protein